MGMEHEASTLNNLYKIVSISYMGMEPWKVKEFLNNGGKYQSPIWVWNNNI